MFEEEGKTQSELFLYEVFENKTGVFSSESKTKLLETLTTIIQLTSTHRLDVVPG